MARDSFDESKSTKKKVTKKKTEVTKPQSSSVTKSKTTTTKADKVASKSTFLGGGAPVQKVEQAASKPKTVTKPSTQKKQTVTQEERINQKSYGTTKPNVTTKTQRTKRDTTPVTSKTQRQINAEDNMNLKQRKIRDTAPVQSIRYQAPTEEVRNAQRRIKSSIAAQTIQNQQNKSSNDAAKREAAWRQRQQEAAHRASSKAFIREHDIVGKTATELIRGSADRKARVPDPFIENITTKEERDKAIKDNREKYKANHEEMQKTAAGRIVSNAPERIITREKRILAETGASLADAGDFLNTGKANPNGRLSQDMGDLLPDREKTRKASRNAYESLTAIRNKEEDKLARLTNNAKGFEKSFYSAEESGQGMLSDYIMSAATGGMWEVPLALRTYGSLRGRAEAEGATTTEDRLNAAKDSVIEVVTEKIGGIFGAGALAPGRKALAPLASRIEGNIAKRLEGKAGRDIISAAGRWARNVGEEYLEEVIANPAENLGENIIFRNRVQAEREAENDAYFADLGNSIQQKFAEHPEEIERYISEMNSPETRNEFISNFKEGGMTDAQAAKVADKMIDFMEAAARNDTETMKAIKSSLDEDLVGDIRKKGWDWNEQLETLASTALLMGVTGIPGAVSTYSQGMAIKNAPDGKAAMESALRKVAEFDTGKSAKAQSLLDSMQNGYEPTATQAYDIMTDESKVMAEMRERERASNQVKQNGMKRERLMVEPAVRNPDGTYSIVGKATSEKYVDDFSATLEYVDAYNQYRYRDEDKISRETAVRAATAVASYKAGTLTTEETASITKENPEERAIFEEMTGIDLSQYDVVKNGKVDAAASNVNMQTNLLARSAQNYVQSARNEQALWNDEERGLMADQIGKRVGGSGDLAVHDALQAVDPRDRSAFMLMGNVANAVYNHAKNSNATWTEVRNTYKRMYPSVDINALKGVYEAGKEDKAEEETPYLNYEVKVGEAMADIKNQDATPQIRGKFVNATPFDEETGQGRDLTASERVVLESLAKGLNANYTMIDAQDPRLAYKDENGAVKYNKASVDLSTGEVLIANNVDISTAVHESTHIGARLASRQYNDMADDIFNLAYKHDPEKTQRIFDAYKRIYADQNLSDAKIKEEVVSDLVSVFSEDPRFVRDISQQNPSLVRKIINAIEDVLRSLRNILATGRIQDPAVQDSFLVEIGAYEQARRMWLEMYREAQKNNATLGLAEWQENVFRDSRTANARHTNVEQAEKERELFLRDSEGNGLTERQAQIIHDIGPDIRFSRPTFLNDLAKGKYYANMNNGKGGFAGLSEIVSGKDILKRTMQKNGFSENQTDAVVGFLSHMADYLDSDELQMRYSFIGWQDLSDAEITVRRDKDDNIVGVAVSAMVVNGEYPVNFDMTTICNKREGVMEVIQELTRKYDADTGRTILNSVKLTDEKMWSINKALKAEGIDTACLGCFVEARRYYTNRFIDKIDDVWNNAVRDARRQLGLPEEEYFNFAKGKKVSGEDYNKISDLWTAYDESTESKRSPSQRIKILMDEIVRNKEVDSPYLKLISAEDILTPEGISGFKKISTKDRDMVKMIKSIYGTSAPKEILAFTPYNSEIALLPDKIKGMETGEYLKSIGGTRVQSFSDFKMAHMFDHMQMVADEAARGFVNHGYSKVIAYPRLFGLTGRKINMSVMFDVLPASTWQATLGCSEEAAKEIADRYQGLRFVKEKPAENPDNRPYIETEIEGVHGYLTYLVSDADYVNSVFDELYQQYLAEGMDEDTARREANKAKPFEQSINYREAVDLENQDGYKENVGIIAVAYGNEHLRMLLDDPNVRYIIPYHRSGLPVFIAQKTALDIAKDYTDSQNTRKAKGGLWADAEGNKVRLKNKYAKWKEEHADEEFPAIAFFRDEIGDYTFEPGKLTTKEKANLAGTGTFDVYENLDKVSDIREISNAYLEHCINNNQVPIFHEFAGHPNYYKMLFDFAVTDAEGNIYPQRPVRNVYPGLDIDAKAAAGEEITEEDYAEFYKAIEEGLQTENAKNELRSNRLGKVLDEDILSREGENSIIADSNIQHIVNGTPDYTNPKSSDVANSRDVSLDDQYMQAVNSNNMDEAQRLVDEAAKIAMPNTKLKGRWYHGTENEFTEFNFSQGGKNGTADGFGIYLTNDPEVASSYGNRMIEGYVNVTRPASALTSQTLTKSELRRLIKRTVEDEALQMAEDYGSNIEEAKFDTWISNYTDTRYAGNIDKAIDEVIKGITSYNGNDMDIIQEIMVGMGIRNYDEATRFYDILTETTGIDGFETKWGDESEMADPNTPTIALAFRSNQIKSADTITYAEDGSVIPLSERFDPTNDDIRYSRSTIDADGKILTDGQMEYFKNSQARDIFGRLVPVYHATDEGGFTIFDPWKSDDHRSLFFTNKRDVANTYVEDKYLSDEDRIGSDDNTEERSGYYQVYLNLENPLIIDGQGQPWNNIVDGGSVFPAYSSITLRNRSWFEEEAEGRDEMYDRGQSLYNGDNARARAQEFEGDDYVEIEIFNGKKKIKAIIPLTEEAVAEEAAAAFGVDDLELLQGVASEIVGDMEFGNITKIYDDDMRNTIGEYGYNTREWAEFAEDEGHDGVIFRNIIDIDDKTEMFDSEEEAASDVYVAFSSNQVKDVNNENPTENPDIRYSRVTEDEVLSQIAYDDAMDNSYELLTYYEQQLGIVNPETFDVTKAFKEEDVVRFLDALKSEDYVPSTDASFEEDRVRRAKSKEDFFNNVYAKWNDRWTTEGEVLKISSVKRDITNLVKGAMANSDSDAQYRNEIVRKTLLDARIAYQLMKQDRTELASYLLYHSAQRMIDGLEFIRDDTAFKEYKEIRDYLRTYRINAPEEYWENEKFLDFRKEYYGRLRIGKGISNIEDVYQDCQDRWPHLFNEAEREKADNLGDSPEDLLLHIGVVVDSNVTPFYEAYSSEEATSFAFDLADQLYEIIANGDREVSLADSYKERYDAKTKALKARHAEAILRERKIREEGIRKERQKFRAYKETQKEKKLHTKYFEGIKSKYDELTKRLLTNTKDKHIPEQYKRELAELLKAFDFQTVGSKKREARTGYKAQKTIKLEAMRTALERIEANSQFFHINDSITDIMKDLLGMDDTTANKQSIEGKTLDELSASELNKIDKLLGALLHEFNNYEKVRVGVKKQQAADLGHAQNNISLEHAEMFGQGKDYQNTPGWIDKILNLDEMTAAYLFKRIDPNKEGLGLMYGEIRKSFDKYVRNQAKLNDWMEEIVGKYHNKGILWNKYGSGELTNWRSDNYAQTFNLEHGPLRLTIAQMMSVACLANRQQARDHMLGAGVVVSPVTFNAKMLSDLKKKANKAVPQKLTETDIKTIEAALTPEQREVANKLQELMATKMAEWGNEASMNVIGIKLFEDPDYFPIRSDRGGLTKDLDPNQFEQAIRNFGFAKAVQPGARNTIMIDDIFDVVTEHCNNMNLYNSYTEAMNDFMKVYNYREVREEGEYTVEQALSHAFSQKAPTFIMQFMRDLNGNVSKRASGIEDAYNSLLGNAKKASVFANLRVAAQQPTAITRAFAVIDPKYLKGIRIGQGDMKEMFDHCPIALWKSWGYYDINMGKSIEDIMMNNGRWLEDKATDLYGALDNVTWTAIWQMVKAEMKDTHPDVKEGTDEYWDLCNERMSEIVDFTQVVDSPMHRSHAMRDKGFLKKTATAFMAEPTLTFNMIRDGWISSREAWKRGDKAEARKIASRTIKVSLLQAATVGGMEAIVDALRKKKPDKDDDDDRFLHLWWVNALENFKNELELWNKVYFVKDIASVFEGWENSNLAFQGIQKFALGYRQLTGDPYARSSAEWYENMADGIGYMWGIPIKTMRTGLANAMDNLGLVSPVFAAVGEKLDSMAKDPDAEKNAFIGSLLSDEKSEGMFGKLLTTKSAASASETNGDSSYSMSEDDLPDNLTDEQKQEILKAGEKRAEKKAAKGLSNTEKVDYDELTFKAMKAAAGLEGEEYDKKVYSVIANGLKDYAQNANYYELSKMRDAIEAAGGDVNYFDQQVVKNSKTAFKKSIKADMTPDEVNQQALLYHYLVTHGVSQEEISSEIVYKSELAKDMKVAFRIGDEETINEALEPLAQAGILQEDLDRLWTNRNRIDLTKYKENGGRYADRLKSMGTFIWPTDGVITSHFGYRNAPTAGASSNHPAIDIGAPQGTAVVAADGGVVISAGANGGYGNSVGIKHDNGMITWYNHLYSWNVKEGDTVAQGQQIAQVGSTGISTGPHLDFKIMDTNGNPVDPEKYLATR